MITRSHPALVLLALAYGLTLPADEIWDAVVANDLARAKTILAADPGAANRQDHFGLGASILQAATFYGQRDVAEVLIDAGADVNHAQATGFTPLLLAALAGQRDAAELLLSRGATVSASLPDGRTPLHLSVDGDPAWTTLGDCFAGALGRLGQLSQTPGDRRIKELLAKLLSIAMPREGQGDGTETASGFGLNMTFAKLPCDYIGTSRVLLDHGAAIDAVDRDGMSPLHYATMRPNVATAELLLSRGADVRIRDASGFSPFHCAAERGNQALLKLIRPKVADLDAGVEDGRTALHLAAATGADATVHFLLAEGARIDPLEHNGLPPLEVACLHGHPDVVASLIAAGASIKTRTSRTGFSVLHSTAMGPRLRDQMRDIVTRSGSQRSGTAGSGTDEEYRRVIQLLVEAGVDLETTDSQGRTALQLAAEFGCAGIVKALLDQGAKPTSPTPGKTPPLYRAAFRGDADIISLLLQRGADPDPRGESQSTALHIAVFRHRVPAVDALLKGGANPDLCDVAGRTPVCLAALNGDADSIRRLGEAGADLEIHDKGGNTPLTIASAMGYREATTALIQSGANINAPTEGPEPVPPLFVAVFKTSRKDMRRIQQVALKRARLPSILPPADPVGVVKSLVAAGADVNATAVGKTALHVAALAEDAEVLNYLLRAGAQINAPDQGGATPLLLAAREGNEDAVATFLAAGADPDISDQTGYGPLHQAAEFDSARITAELLKHGADPKRSTRDGITPLHLAAYFGHPGPARILLEHGAPVDAVTTDRTAATPLAQAVYGMRDFVTRRQRPAAIDPTTDGIQTTPGTSAEFRVVVRLLVQAGADPEAPDGSGMTPRATAIRDSLEDLRDILWSTPTADAAAE